MKFLVLKILLLSALISLTGCATKSLPSHTHDDICKIIEYDKNWYIAAKKSQDKWGTPVPTLKAFIHQESRFQAKARPPRNYFLGVIPLPRRSSAYGYAQAQDPAWQDYQKATKRFRARRDNLHDALDFIGWYNSVSRSRNGIPLSDSYNLYLAYHEGHGGFSRRTYEQKAWLKRVAKKVQRKSWQYDNQLKQCKVDTNPRFCIWPFC